MEVFQDSLAELADPATLPCYNLRVPAAAKHEYNRADALRVLRITERQLRSWEKLGLVDAAEVYRFPQLIALQTLARLRASKQPAARIQRAVAAVQRKLTHVRNPLQELKLYSEGNRIRVQLGRHSMEPESGQLLLDFGEAEMERMVSLPRPRVEETEADVKRRRREAETWFLRGVELEQSGSPIDEAVDAYSIAISLDPLLSAALVNLGTIHFTMQRWDKAEKYYRRALEANPKYPLAHFNIGNLHDERGDRVQAREHYLKALDLDPQYADAHYNLALLYQATGESMKAMRHWRTYLKLDSRSQWAEVARRELDRLYASALVKGGSTRFSNPA
jgi:tetratricopeptide (TPR) repeat protein